MSDTRHQTGTRDKASRKRAGRRPRGRPLTRGLGAWFLETYASADPRSLAVFRMLFALVLIHDVWRRWPDLVHHYSNSGWLTNHFAMFRPMSDHLFSLYLAFSTIAEVKVLAAFQILVGCSLFVGWHTRVMQVLAFVLIVSLNSRNIMLENGGFVVVHLIALWSLFLPLGRRYSVDALRESLVRRREGTLAALNDQREPRARTAPVVSLAVTVLILQFAIIYYFNVVHKTGPEWKDGTAVYYFFEQDRMVTALGAWLRHHLGIEVVRLMTWSTLVMESLIALFLVSPVYSKVMRMVGWALVLVLHAGIDAVVQLGPFSYAMFVVHACFIPREFWTFLERRRLRAAGVRVLYLDERCGFSLWLGRLSKRLLPRGSVRFARNEEQPGQPLSDALVITLEGRHERQTGVRALQELVRASTPLRLAFAALGVPALRQRADRWIDACVAKREKLTQWFGLGLEVGLDSRAQARSSGERWRARARALLNHAVLSFFVVACASQVLVENRAIPRAFKPDRRPEWMIAAVVYPRLFQGWSMFAPSPPRDDGKIVVEGRTKQGRPFDPLTQSAPDYELDPPGGFRMNQLWGDFHRRIWQPRFRPYWNGFSEYLRQHHRITGRGDNELAAFEVYYVSQIVPPPGAPKPAPQKQRLFSWGNMRSFDASEAVPKARR